jgi:hypothetical protein
MIRRRAIMLNFKMIAIDGNEGLDFHKEMN